MVDLASGNTIGLNPVATFLWSHLDGHHDDAELVTAVVGEFEVSSAVAEHDTREFLDEMKRRTLIIDTQMDAGEPR